MSTLEDRAESYYRSLPQERGPGWRLGQIMFQPGNLGCLGVLGPDNLAWEIEFAAPPDSVRGRKNAILRDSLLGFQAGARSVCLVTVEGTRYLVSRLEHTPTVWNGLVPLALDWHDFSCGDSPAQLSRDMAWTRPDGVVESVTLYLRWRWEDPWTGVVQRAVGMFETLHAPWSPNLLPTDLSVPAGAGIFDLHAPQGYRLDQLPQAKEALVRLADAWLRAHGRIDSAWEVVPSRPSPEVVL